MDDHITSKCFLFVCLLRLGVDYIFLEPLRRNDLINAINKLAGERKVHLARSRISHRQQLPMSALLREFR